MHINMHESYVCVKRAITGQTVSIYRFIDGFERGDGLLKAFCLLFGP